MSFPGEGSKARAQGFIELLFQFPHQTKRPFPGRAGPLVVHPNGINVRREFGQSNYLWKFFRDENFLSALEEIDLNPIVGSNRGLRKHVEFDHAV